MSSMISLVWVAFVFVMQGAMPGTPVVECRLAGKEGERVYQVVDKGADREPRWWLTLRSGARDARLIELPLPAAKIAHAAGRTTVSSASANGGLAVEIVAADTGAWLEVFVNFELEVNVWRDLSPEVEQMNTGGPRRDARCVILSERSGLP